MMPKKFATGAARTEKLNLRRCGCSPLSLLPRPPRSRPHLSPTPRDCLNYETFPAGKDRGDYDDLSVGGGTVHACRLRAQFVPTNSYAAPQVSPATYPPCNVDNSCSMIRDEIRRGCALIGAGAPNFATSIATSTRSSGPLASRSVFASGALCSRLVSEVPIWQTELRRVPHPA